MTVRILQDNSHNKDNSSSVGMSQSSLSIPTNGGIVNRAVTAAAANINKRRSTCGRESKYYSVSVFYSMATGQDNEIEDELAKAQNTLRELKSNISKQSKNNFLLERDVRFLDSRIALLIQNRMALDEQNEIASQLEDSGDGQSCENYHHPDDRKMQKYGNLFFLLQSEPHYIASLCRLVSLSEIDTLLQTVMFTLYGNQYESREENLLLTMFQNVLAAQFESAVEFGSLLRANTPVSRMLTTYTRRGPGQSYLKSVLSENINQLIYKQKDLNLQINPLKVYDEIVARMELDDVLPPGFNKSVTPDVAASNATVQSLIQPRLEKLMEIANLFLTTIIDSLNQVPYGIRWICKQIRSLTKRKYPEATDSAISSLIGGFFFLRYLNPAIVTPQAYMLIESFPGANPRTTLTLIAKMLQNLANKPSYAKETYMIPTNPFVKENKQRINQFLNDLCEVSDFYESLEMDQYMALSRRDLHISITPNELYNTHALLSRHLNQLAPDYTNHLRVLLKDLGLAPNQVPRKFNRPIQLPLFGRWDTSNTSTTLDAIAETTSDSSITQNDILYMETKSAFVQIVRSLPTTIKAWDLPSILEAAGSAKDAQVVTKGIKVQAMLQDLEDAGVVTKENNYELLMQEIKTEMVQLGDLRKRVDLEIESLEKVNKTIEDHTQYLQGQLDSYKAYLKNVRLQSNQQQQRNSSSSNNNNNKKTVLADILKPNSSSASINNIQQDTTVNSNNSKSIFNIYGNNHGTRSLPSIPSPILPTPNNKNSKNSKNKKPSNSGPYKFTHLQLEKDGVITQSEVPDYRKVNIFLLIQSPITGTFIISLHYKGREKPILEIDLKLDDLLEKQREQVQSLDLEYIKLNVSKIVQLINKSFKAKSSSRLGFF